MSQEARIKAFELRFVKGLFGRWHVSFSLIDFFPSEELLTLFREVCSGSHIHHAEVHFVDQCGLVRHPFCPGLLGHIEKNIFSSFAGEGGQIQSGEFLLELAAKYGTGHN